MPVRTTAAASVAALALGGPASATPLESDGLGLKERAQAFATPLVGPLESPFGQRWGLFHSGIDIAVLRTDAVRAALPGVVTAVGYLPRYSGYGNIVKLRHAKGIATLYAHLASARVHVGQWVGRGALIGRAGCTGSCTGAHLHFEVRAGGRLVDPLHYLAGRFR